VRAVQVKGAKTALILRSPRSGALADCLDLFLDLVRWRRLPDVHAPGAFAVIVVAFLVFALTVMVHVLIYFGAV
jgi:hypothetical protein